MIRRVAAVEGTEMVTEGPSEEEDFLIPAVRGGVESVDEGEM